MNDPTKRSGQLTAEFHAHALALGEACIRWSHLEWMLDELLASLLELSNREIFETVAHNTDLREKLRILLGLSYQLKKDEVWFAVVQWCINLIDNDLRPRRNRFVHDRWGIFPDGIKKIQASTGLRKPQAFKTEFYTKIETLVPAEEIQKLCDELYKMFLRITILIMAFRAPSRSKDLIGVLADCAPIPAELLKAEPLPHPAGGGKDPLSPQ